LLRSFSKANYLKKIVLKSPSFVFASLLLASFFVIIQTQAATPWIQTVDSEGNVGWYSAIALDFDGNPHISYSDLSHGDLKYALWIGSKWNIQTVDSEGEAGLHSSLAVDSNDCPRISYFDGTHLDLKYASSDAASFPISPPSPSPSPSPTPTPTQGTQVVDSIGDVGMYSSLALDSNGNPRISYFDFHRMEVGSLKYASWTGSSWTVQVVDSEGNVGTFPSLVLDSNDNPHISYKDNLRGNVKYASWSGSGWNIQTIGSGDFGSYSSLALDSNGNPHISYYATLNEDLKYTSWTGAAWNVQLVDSEGFVGSSNSLALDSNDNPHISYFYLKGALKYAHYDGSAWHVETVDSGGAGVGFDSSLALDSNGNVHISYFSFVAGGFTTYLKYASWNGSSWNIVTVDSGNGIGKDSSLALDSNGSPHISYYDMTNGDLRYAWWNGTGWDIRIIDSEGNVGESSSLALDPDGHAHISYYDRTNGGLKYVEIVDPARFPTPGSSPSPSPSPSPNSSLSIKILSPASGGLYQIPQNAATTDIPLTFTMNGPVSWMGYPLYTDNVTITGNTTLTELSASSRSLVIYANDTAGNTYASNWVYFTVAHTPIVTINSPTNNTVYTTNSVTVNITASDPSTGVQSVNYRLDGTNYSGIISGVQPGWHQIQGSTVFSGLPNGNYTLTAVAHSWLTGAIGTSVAYFTVNVPSPSSTPTPSPTSISSSTQSQHLETVLPEFPSWIILSTLMIATLVGGLVYKKKSIKLCKP
jgi:hypothetical protein